MKDIVSLLRRSMKTCPGDKGNFEDICKQLKNMDKVLSIPRKSHPAKASELQQVPVSQTAPDNAIIKSTQRLQAQPEPIEQLSPNEAGLLKHQSPNLLSTNQSNFVPPAMRRRALRHDVKFRLRRQTELTYVKISALSLDNSGLRVAVMVRNEVHILPSMEDEIPTESRLLSREGDWSKIQLAYPYVAAYESGNGKLSHVSLSFLACTLIETLRFIILMCYMFGIAYNPLFMISHSRC